MVKRIRTYPPGYSSGHKKISQLKGQPKKCEKCGTEDINLRYEWANLTGNYNDIDDYRRMCQPCHIKFDNSATRGENHPKHKLTEEDVREIRQRYIKGSHGPNSTPSLAKEFGVHQRKIWEIVNMKAWKHVK